MCFPTKMEEKDGHFLLPTFKWSSENMKSSVWVLRSFRSNHKCTTKRTTKKRTNSVDNANFPSWNSKVFKAPRLSCLAFLLRNETFLQCFYLRACVSFRLRTPKSPCQKTWVVFTLIEKCLMPWRVSIFVSWRLMLRYIIKDVLISYFCQKKSRKWKDGHLCETLATSTTVSESPCSCQWGGNKLHPTIGNSNLPLKIAW